MPAPMKFWELISAFKTEESLLLSVLAEEQWRNPYLTYFQTRAQLIAEQKRDILDALVPTELSRSVAKQSEQKFFCVLTKNVIRSYVIVDEEFSLMTALEVHERFGGSVIEEVQECGSATV